MNGGEDMDAPAADDSATSPVVSRRGVLTGLGASIAVVAAGRPDTAGAGTTPSSAAGPPSAEVLCELPGLERIQAAAPAPAPSGDPAEVGEWSAPFNTGVTLTAVHAVLLHTGNVLLLKDTNALEWNPSTGQAVSVDVADNNFCAAQTVLADGDVLFVGGRLLELSQGPPWTYAYHPASSTWTKGADMARGRWYPTAAMLPDGRVAILSGKLADGKTLNPDVEVWEDGVMTVVGSQTIHMYPHMFLMPSGKMLVVGPSRNETLYLHPDFHFTRLGRMAVNHVGASGTLLPGAPAGSTQVLVAGGGASTGVGATAIVERIDTQVASPTWTTMSPLPEPRSNMNVVTLPDGQLLGIGGNNDAGATRMSLMYHAPTDTWRTLTAQVKQRGYHSVGVLLPDGRVLSAGDTTRGGGKSSMELYSPPYLFKGPRPTISASPPTAGYGTTFDLGTPDVVERVVLVRPNAVTHTCEMNQRHVELAFTTIVGGVRVSTPPNNRVAPPGHYMLFVLNALGVPSVASWIQF